MIKFVFFMLFISFIFLVVLFYSLANDKCPFFKVDWSIFIDKHIMKKKLFFRARVALYLAFVALLLFFLCYIIEK